MQIPIVNENDEIIGSKDRALLNYSTDIFRTASLWVTNSDGDVLLAQRKMNKKLDPGKWAEAVGGTVEGDDSYEATVIREAGEELGLRDIRTHPGPKQYIDSSAKCFVQWYTLVLDLPIEAFSIQGEEVESITWMPMDQLKQELNDTPEKYIPSMKDIVQLFS